MPLIIFPAIRADDLEAPPRLAELCSHCGKLVLSELGESGGKPICTCSYKGEEFAVVSLLTPDQQQVWDQLTPLVPDHVIGRVLRVMYGEEQAGGAR